MECSTGTAEGVVPVSSADVAWDDKSVVDIHKLVSGRALHSVTRIEIDGDRKESCSDQDT